MNEITNENDSWKRANGGKKKNPVGSPVVTQHAHPSPFLSRNSLTITSNSIQFYN